VLFCRDRGLMGDLVNSRGVTALASVVVAVIVSLNVYLLYQAALSIT
jgi:manganese transport protein